MNAREVQFEDGKRGTDTKNSPKKSRNSPEKKKHRNKDHKKRDGENKKKKKKDDEKGGIASDESVDLTDEERKQDEGLKIEEEPVEVKKVVKETYKLTTSRYQGMLEEEYNEDDLELIRINSERNLMVSKVTYNKSSKCLIGQKCIT